MKNNLIDHFRNLIAYSKRTVFLLVMQAKVFKKITVMNIHILLETHKLIPISWMGNMIIPTENVKRQIQKQMCY